MKSSRPLHATLLALVGSALSALSATEGWVSDLAQAKRVAAQVKQDVLICFTGANAECKALKSEVFSQAAFKKEMRGKFILVEIEFPGPGARVVPEIAQRNQKLASLYQIAKLPSVVLADSRGRPYGRTGYQKGGAEGYLKHLELLQRKRADRDQKFAKARTLKGPERAQALQTALDGLHDKAVTEFYPEIIKQIGEADPNDTNGFLKARNYRLAIAKFESSIDGLYAVRAFSTILSKVDEFLATHQPTGIEKQRVLMPKVMAYVELGKKDEAFEQIELMRVAAPESDLAAQLDGIKLRLAEMIAKKSAEKKPKPGPAPAPAPAPVPK